MITLRSAIRPVLEAACAQTFYFYPASWTRVPCVAWRESGNREFARADGRERLAELTYTVDVWAAGAEACADIAAQIDAGLRALRLKRVSCADLYEPAARLNHVSMRFRALADANGNVYQ